MEDTRIVPSLKQEEKSHIEEQNVLNSWNLVTCYYITNNKLLVGMNGKKYIGFFDEIWSPLLIKIHKSTVFLSSPPSYFEMKRRTLANSRAIYASSRKYNRRRAISTLNHLTLGKYLQQYMLRIRRSILNIRR